MIVHRQHTILVIVTAVSLATILLQLPAISHQKAVVGDDQKSDDISTLHSKIDSYSYQNGALPSSLKSLSTLPSGLEERITDYNYEKTSIGFDEGYKLCTSFKTAQGMDDDEDSYESSYSSTYVDTHKHNKGNICFSYKKPYTTSRTSTYPSSTSTLNSQNKYNDTTRQKNLESIKRELTAYYGVHQKYPTLAEINDKSWRTTNMKYLLDSAMKDPDSTSTVPRLAAKAAKGVYAYEPVGPNGTTCDNTIVQCTSFTLTATLSNNSRTMLYK